MDWFAEQRLLDLEPAEQHDRPWFRDSIGYLGGKGQDAITSVPRRPRSDRSTPEALPALDLPDAAEPIDDSQGGSPRSPVERDGD